MEKGGERERNINLLFYLIMHLLVVSGVCFMNPDQVSNPQPWYIGSMLLSTELPGQGTAIFKVCNYPHVADKKTNHLESSNLIRAHNLMSGFDLHPHDLILETICLSLILYPSTKPRYISLSHGLFLKSICTLHLIGSFSTSSHQSFYILQVSLKIMFHWSYKKVEEPV